MGNEDKIPFQTKAEEEKKAYQTAEEEFKKTDEYKKFLNEKVSHKKKQDDKKAKDEVKKQGMPKRPLSSWMLFVTEKSEVVMEELKKKGEQNTVKNRTGALKVLYSAL